jgi:hypothetical protein
MKKYITGILLTITLFAFSNTWAGGSQDFNDCRTTLGDFCERAGSCAIQGSAWYQFVTIDKSGKFDTYVTWCMYRWYKETVTSTWTKALLLA